MQDYDSRYPAVLAEVLSIFLLNRKVESATARKLAVHGPSNGAVVPSRIAKGAIWSSTFEAHPVKSGKCLKLYSDVAKPIPILIGTFFTKLQQLWNHRMIAFLPRWE